MKPQFGKEADEVFLLTSKKEVPMKRKLLALLLVAFFTTGCTGSFNLTRKVYNWHRSQDDKWLDEFGFLVCAILPIYGISTFADAIVFNSIEFWTGDNPVDEPNRVSKSIKEGADEATLSYNKENKQITIASATKPTITLEKQGNMVIAKDEAGKVVSTALMNANGQMVVLDQNMELVKAYSPAELDAMKAKFVK
jgi:hypothetical protein